MRAWHFGAALVLCCALVALFVSNTTRQPTPKAPAPEMTLEPFEGRVEVSDIELLQVGKKRVQLCGVRYSKAPSLRPLVLTEMRKQLKGLRATCQPVGTGTVCDGRGVATNGTVTIAQCFSKDGRDIASIMSDNGLLCDDPERSGGAYKSC